MGHASHPMQGLLCQEKGENPFRSTLSMPLSPKTLHVPAPFFPLLFFFFSMFFSTLPFFPNSVPQKKPKKPHSSCLFLAAN